MAQANVMTAQAEVAATVQAQKTNAHPSGSWAAVVTEHTLTSGSMRKESGIRATMVLHHPGLCFALMGQAQNKKEKDGQPNKASSLVFVIGQAHFSGYRNGILKEVKKASNLGPAQLILNYKEAFQSGGGNQSKSCTPQPKSLQQTEIL